MKAKGALIRNLYGFTLIEILIGMVILSIISIGMFSAFPVVTGLQVQSSDEATANALAQGFLEEIRSQADLNFEGLEGIYSSDDENPVPDYPGFTFNQRVERINFDLKRAQARVSWTRGGRTENVLLATLLTRPPELLPGNIEGYIYQAGTTTGIQNATVTATNGQQNFSARTNPDGYYTFVSRGQYQIPPGDWTVSATANGYYSSEETGASVTCTVPSALTAEADPIYLTALPEPGSIKVSVKDRSNMPLSGIKLALRQGGSQARDNNGNGISWPKYTDGAGEYLYANLRPGNYTAYTYDTYLSGYTCFFGDRPGDPDFALPYWHAGWSSVWSPTDKPPSFSNYAGPPDNVNVVSDTATNIDIFLDPIPTGTVTGIVYKDDDRDGMPDDDGEGGWEALVGARVWIWWYNGVGIKAVQTDSSGRYTANNVYIPYFVFSDTWSYRNKMRAEKSGYDSRYPSTTLSSPGVQIGGPYNRHVYLEHDTATRDVNFLLPKKPPPPEPEYGNVEGYVTVDTGDPDVSGSPLSGVTVSIGGRANATDAIGHYLIENIRVGRHTVTGSRSDYYGYNSVNAGDGKVNVVKDQTVQFNFAMEAIGYGDIIGNVTSKATGLPIGGALVTVGVYSGAPGPDSTSTPTDSNGDYTLSHIVETRPGKLHRVSASADGYVAKTESGVELLEDETITKNFELSVDTGGM